MSPAEQFRETVAELDELVYKQDFPAAAECAARLAELARRAGREHLPDETISPVAESMRIIETARRKICVSRARMQAYLLRLEGAAEYCAAVGPARHTWSVEG